MTLLLLYVGGTTPNATRRRPYPSPKPQKDEDDEWLLIWEANRDAELYEYKETTKGD